MRHARLIALLICLVSPGLARAEARPLLRAELDRQVAVPGQIITLDVTILVPTWLPEPPEFPNFEIPDVSVRLPEGASRPALERIEGDTWSGVSRSYQLSPMVVGRFRIPPQTLVVTFADPDSRAPLVARLQTQEFLFEGRAPAGAEGLVPFIAAHTLTLEQEIDRDPEDLEPGAAFTRTVTARLTGASPIFLPRLVPPLSTAGLAAYPKEPEFVERSNRGQTTGERIERVTYVAEAGGRFRAAPIRLRWWNLQTEEIEVAELPALEILSRGPAPMALAVARPRELVPWIAAVVLLLLIAGAAGRWSWPRLSRERRRRRETKLASESFAFDRVVAAMKARRFGEVVQAVERWSMRLAPDSEAARKRLFDPLGPLGSSLYGRESRAPTPAQWSTALSALRAARRDCLARKNAEDDRSRVLPPLNPATGSTSLR